MWGLGSMLAMSLDFGLFNVYVFSTEPFNSLSVLSYVCHLQYVMCSDSLSVCFKRVPMNLCMSPLFPLKGGLWRVRRSCDHGSLF